MMNLLARILSHGFAITVVLLLAIGFMYRGELFPEWELPGFLVLDSSQEPAGSDTAGTISREDATGAVTEATDTTSEVAAAPDAESDAEPDASLTEGTDGPGTMVETATETVPEITPATAPETAPEITPETAPEITPETAPETAPEITKAAVEASAAGVPDSKQADLPDVVETAGDAVVEQAVTEAGQTDTAEVDAVEADSKPMADIPVYQETVTETVIDEEAEEPALVEPARMDMQQDVIEEPSVAIQETQESPETAQDSAVTSETGPYQLLAAAREAYWLRDYDLAESQYQKLIERQPDNPDGYGELGNMYFSQGNWEAAASAYYEAGTRLVKEGQLVQAQQMVDVIRGLNGSRADDLAQQVDAARTGSN